MEVAYHPLVREDVIGILRYYRGVSRELADEFYNELRTTIDRAAENPVRFHVAGKGFRRANLSRFPYHVIYEVRAESIRVMIVRHNKRHPNFGMERT
jgi:plasmid stabilization system protein ParE